MVDAEERVRQSVAAKLRAVEHLWRRRQLGKRTELDLRIAGALTTATANSGMSWAQLREAHSTVVQYPVFVSAELQHDADELVVRVGVERLLEHAAEEWLTTTMDLGDFHRAALGVIDPHPDADAPVVSS